MAQTLWILSCGKKTPIGKAFSFLSWLAQPPSILHQKRLRSNSRISVSFFCDCNQTQKNLKKHQYETNLKVSVSVISGISKHHSWNISRKMVVNFSKRTIQFSRGPSSSRNRGDAASVAWDVVGGQRERRTADRDLAEFGATNSDEFP